MPFTPTHAAAAIPIAWMCRWQIPVSALAIGTLVPDVANYYPSLIDYGATHSWQGILTHCMPVGMLLFYVYHGVLKQPLAELLPGTMAARLRPWIERPIDFSTKHIFLVAVLVMFGAATHIVWDAYTHHDRWGVESTPFLSEIVLDWGPRPIRWYAVLQHGSSIVLLPTMLLGFILWVRTLPEVPASRPRYRFPQTIALVVVLLMILAVLGHWQWISMVKDGWLWIDTLKISVKQSGAFVVAIVLAYCVGMQIVWWRQTRVTMQ